MKCVNFQLKIGASIFGPTLSPTSSLLDVRLDWLHNVPFPAVTHHAFFIVLTSQMLQARGVMNPLVDISFNQQCMHKSTIVPKCISKLESDWLGSGLVRVGLGLF